ncbi:fructuronate reductase [Kaistia soli DSM 19436]|uniref:Fructuronate reductase n=1 Tax=Kaistia soli DSM 19436 TaxID=1122133 RepID=A0A1M5ILJ2_9HYPH|nr:mannitol dehydrogenase family protein [Kaistia soli]SHG28909.1 fructuronate reductase [Kaistia soli DSM 19436]
MSAAEALRPALLARLPDSVARPAYDRAAVTPGIAHIGVGAFHRAHQAEFTDDVLAGGSTRWGITGINIRPPELGETLGRQGGLYTRLIREDQSVAARVIGSIVSVVDSQDSAAPALAVLSASEIDVITMTVTEKGYCHTPATGALDASRPEIVHDLAHPEAPTSLPGLILRALELRMQSHGRPVTVVSCDNIPANGDILGAVVRELAARRGGGIAGWIEANVAFPGTMVDRIAPATSEADYAFVENQFGYRDRAVVVGEPFRQWVIENRFAGPFPPYDRVGAAFVDDVTAFEHLKMRILNGAQTALCYLGVLAGHEHTFDDMADPLLAHFARRMLLEESLPTLAPVPGIVPEVYVEQSLARLRNTAIRHRNHQIATDGSQKIVQRLLNPIRDRLAAGAGIDLLALAVAGWMAYLVRASDRFGRAWSADDPYAGRVAAIADRIGSDPARLVEGIVAIDAIFAPALAADARFRTAVTGHLGGLLADDPMQHVRRVMGQGELEGA